MLAGWISRQRAAGDRNYSLDSVRSYGERIVVAYSWSDKTGRRHTWAQALHMRGGKIVELQDFASQGAAAALTSLRAAFA